jgi:hypothetical protein
MRRRLRLIPFALLILITPTSLHASSADSTAEIYKIALKDGSTIVGTITSSTLDTLVVQTGSGIIMGLPRRTVTSMERLRGRFVNGEYLRVDPNGTRLLFGPTARPLKGGTGYFAAYQIFFTYLSIGVADFLSLGGGLTLLPGASDQVFYLSPKIAFTTNDEMFSGAVGAFYLNATAGSSYGLGIVYGAATYGTPRAGLTFGVGYGYSQDEFSENPVILLGAEVQASNSVKLITENWFPVGTDFSILSFGFRFFGDNLAADLGFFYPMWRGSGISEGFPLIPWLGFAYNFGR